MKYTKYYLHTKTRLDRIHINDEWIKKAFQHPVHEEYQCDGRIRRWAWIQEEQKYLRIILLPDEETLHNAFFDRGFDGGEK